MGQEPLTVEFLRSFSSIDAAQWDRCAGTENPFVSYDFLSSLEQSGCIGPATGWLPLPALARRKEQTVGAVPVFIKLHSKGEYIFDYGWADAYPRLLGPEQEYYPKLQVAVPFTPVPGPRFLVAPGEDKPATVRLLQEALRSMVEQLEMSSVHVTFCQEQEAAVASGEFMRRLGEQYHWHNDGYSDFEDFLGALTSRKRKAIRRERRKVAEYPLRILTLHGHEATAEQWDAFYRMYLDTSMRKWGQPYLNRALFTLLGERLRDRIVLFLVEKESDGRLIAGAWNVRGDSALFGRNWGCLEHHEFLHFEVCYYQAIEYAIRHGLQRVEAGAQGMHKIQRGYLPVPVHSIHHFRHPVFARAIADYLSEERAEERFRLAALEEMSPFRSNCT